MQQKPNLDLLRSLAILLVLLDHCLLVQDRPGIAFYRLYWDAGWLGVFGVYLFFVHTCLVLMWSLDRKPHTLDFYIRRIFRIYPLAIVAILAVVSFRLPFSSDTTHFFTTYHPTFTGVLANLLLIQNISHRGGYVLGVLWSLPLEVEMYVLLPFLYFFVRRNFSLWPLLLLWLMCCGLAQHQAVYGNFFSTVIPCFLPGVMAYVLFARTKPALSAGLFPVFLISLLAAFMHFSTTVAAWFICLLLGLALPFFKQIAFAPLRHLTHHLAKYSYSIYLTHMFGLGISFRLLSFSSVPLKLTLSLALTALFSLAGYHLLEAPMIRVGARLAVSAEERYEQHLNSEAAA